MQAFVVTVPLRDVEFASDVLWGLGVVAIEERPAASAAFVDLWTAVGDEPDAIAEAAAGLDGRWAWRTVDVDERVADTWRDYAEPTWITPDLVVCPAWRGLVVDVPICLQIEPGSTFGMGDHPTTVLSLRALAGAITGGETVLDVGCGSGVLAIGACRLGASRAHGIDISPACVEVTTANAAANDVADRVTVATTPLAEVDGTYDIVVANILAPVLIELADELRRVLAPHGLLIISGVLADHHDHVEQALRPLARVDRIVHDGWAAVSLRMPATD
jgi:ribosomal protein L11 methyltransferase